MAKTQLVELLAALGAGAVLLGGCAGAPDAVKATEVPGATPSAMPDVAHPDTGAVKPPDASALPSATPAAMASGAPAAGPADGKMPKASDMPKTNHSVKVSDSKRKKACDSGCGAGTCGSADCK
jgi:hypothetical protein